MRKKNRSIAVFVIVIIVCFVLFGCGYRYRSNNNGDRRPAISCNKRNPKAYEMPDGSGQDFIIYHSAYTLSYNSNTLSANWVAYELTAEETEGPWSRKGLRFMPDPDCKSRQADNNDYRNSGYSRGHLAPAGDMKWDSVAMVESFYFTNCIPQDKELNNGRWNQLEMKTRAWAKEYGRVYVVSGPVFLDDDTLRIGYNGVAVPDACYKALLAPIEDGYSAIAFVMQNGGENRSIKECAFSVDQLEALLGLDLFFNLPNEIENTIESKIVLEDWNLK